MIFVIVALFLKAMKFQLVNLFKTKAMSPAINTIERTEEIHTSGITTITLKEHGNYVNIYQNDELITAICTPIMKMVRILRKHYNGEVKLEVI
jgi:hypothetical protein